MANDWITKPILLGALCTVLLLGGTANYIWDYQRDCTATDARSEIRSDQKEDIRALEDKIDKTAEKATKQVSDIKDEIMDVVNKNEEHQRDDMKEIKDLIKENGRTR